MIAGVLASWLVSFLHNGTLVVMPAIMFGCTVFTLGLLLLLPRLKKQEGKVVVMLKSGWNNNDESYGPRVSGKL